ncbi:hypothetical protein [Corynebacterium sp.]|uniref:hypothetical protein n=1 Tax=Corynebacterium sp. TaxID=1720 RepID=UPI0028A76079|nr:hypothetical protein [Corynebacterium sp.]
MPTATPVTASQAAGKSEFRWIDQPDVLAPERIALSSTAGSNSWPLVVDRPNRRGVKAGLYLVAAMVCSLTGSLAILVLLDTLVSGPPMNAYNVVGYVCLVIGSVVAVRICLRRGLTEYRGGSTVIVYCPGVLQDQVWLALRNIRAISLVNRRMELAYQLNGILFELANTPRESPEPSELREVYDRITDLNRRCVSIHLGADA